MDLWPTASPQPGPCARRRARVGSFASGRWTERVLDNAAVARLLEKERTLGANLRFEDIIGEVGAVYPKIMQEGDMDTGAWSCGMVAGLIHDVPTCR